MAYKDVISGIYTITHVNSGRVYVGSATNIYQRWNNHRCSFAKDNGKATPYLRQAWNKYGPDAFRFEIIEVVPDKSRLLEREQFWIDCYDATNRSKGFNIASKAGSNLGIKPSPESIAKRVEKIRGRKRSDGFRQQASAWMKGNQHGKGHYVGRLCESDILPIFEAVACGRRVEDIATGLNVHRASIGRVINRKTWDHVNIPDVVVHQAQINYHSRRRETLRSDPRVTTLSAHDVAIIKARLLDGETGASLARKYGVTDTTIYAIKTGKNWKDIMPIPLR